MELEPAIRHWSRRGLEAISWVEERLGWAVGVSVDRRVCILIEDGRKVSLKTASLYSKWSPAGSHDGIRNAFATNQARRHTQQLTVCDTLLIR